MFKKYSKTLEFYLHNEIIPYLINAWNDNKRKYHNYNHLKDVIKYIERNTKNLDINVIEFEILILAAFFHDAYYNTKSNKIHEDESIKLFLSSYKSNDYAVRNKVIDLINCTKFRKRPLLKLERLFWDADNNGFYKSFNTLIKNENNIRLEYLHVPKNIYKEKRIEFLKTNLGLFNSIVDNNILKLINYVNKY